MERDMLAAVDIIRQLDEAAAQPADPGEIDALFDALVETYRQLDGEEERGRVRIAYCRSKNWTGGEYWHHFPSYTQRFRNGGEPDDLRRMIAHYSLTDGWPDMRDAILGLVTLQDAAKLRDVDAGPVFAEFAPLSSPDDRSGIGSMRGYMEKSAR